MKTSSIILATVVFVMALISAEAANIPVPLPDFLNKEQLTALQKTRATQPAGKSTATSASDQFYTGKPYVSDAGGYVFKYRTYSPETSRWTSADPGGFPDGANNLRYAPRPTSEIDSKGLFDDGTSYISGIFDDVVDRASWDSIEAGGSPMAVEAMEHADGTIPGPMYLSSDEKDSVKGSSAYGTFYDYVQSLLEPVPGDPSVGGPSPGSFSTPEFQVLFTHGSDLYYAMGHARLQATGAVTYDENWRWTYAANVTITDSYTFAGDASADFYTPTALGYRLQTHGYIHEFSTKGTFTDTWYE